MTGKDRLLRTIRRQDVDRISVAPFIHVNFVKAFLGTDGIDLIAKTIEVYEHFGFDIIHRNCTPAYTEIGLDTPDWRVERTTVEDGRDQTTTTVVHTPKGDLREVYRTIWVSEYDAESSPVEYLIKSECDFELIEEFQPPVEMIDVSPIRRAKEMLGDRGLIAPWGQGAFNHVAIFYRALDDLILDAMTNPGFYSRMMEYFLRRNMSVLAQHIDAGVDICSCGGNIASGKLIGPAFFDEFVLPYEQRLIEFVQSRGAMFLYHNCGYAKNLLPSYTKLGMKLYESLTPPPYGDTDLQHAFNTLGDTATLCGGLDQIDFLRTASHSEIRARVKQILSIARPRGGFILGTTDYFHEETPLDNIAAFADAARELGHY